jgi:hypothetical protein
MTVTVLKRKVRRRVTIAKNRQASIKMLNAKPVIKKVDVEEIKKSFSAKA